MNASTQRNETKQICIWRHWLSIRFRRKTCRIFIKGRLQRIQTTKVHLYPHYVTDLQHEKKKVLKFVPHDNSQCLYLFCFHLFYRVHICPIHWFEKNDISVLKNAVDTTQVLNHSVSVSIFISSKDLRSHVSALKQIEQKVLVTSVCRSHTLEL